MSYIVDNIMRGEKIIYLSRLHIVVFSWPFIWITFAIYFFSKKGDAGFLTGIVFVLVAIVAGIDSFISFKTAEFGVTNKRVMVKVGFIRSNSFEILLNKIEGIHVTQGIFGRFFGFGSIAVIGTGGTKNPFNMIKEPFEFRKKVQEQIAAIQDSRL